MSFPAFEPEAILAALEREAVKYIVIGGLAAALHGSPLLTQDIDICPARDLENLERLARALRGMGAKIRTDDAPDGRTLLAIGLGPTVRRWASFAHSGQPTRVFETTTSSNQTFWSFSGD